MNYEEKYNELVLFLKELRNCMNTYAKEKLESFIPELCESEDEMIRKALIKYLDALDDDEIRYGVSFKNMRTWLEKQGEQKPDNKVKQKFRKGDWVVSPNGVYWHIDAINNNRYEVSSDTGKCADWPLDTDLYHLWTIQDAKDGDVLNTSSTASHEIFIFKGLTKEGKVAHFLPEAEDFGVSLSRVL